MLSRALRAPWWIQTAFAVLAAAVAFALTLFLDLRDHPFLLPMIAVLLTALRGGVSAGFVCGATTLALADYYLVPPTGRFSVPALSDAYELAIFAFTAAIISILAARGRQAQLTLEATVASIGDGVIVTDDDGRVTFLNKVAESLTGWRLAEATGKPVTTVFNVVHEQTGAAVLNPVDQALRDRAIVGLAKDTKLVCRDGTERPIDDSGAPILDQQQRIIGAVLVFRDASPQRNAETALKQQARERLELLDREKVARADAERANRLKDEFLATLSHELRTPLNAVLGWSHMLTRRQLTADQQKQALAAIHRNAQAQARLVDDVLDLSRIVTGRMALSAEPVDVSEIVRTTAESFTPAFLGKRQELRLKLARGADITGDPHRLRQIVWNLLSNATKFTPERGSVSVEVKADRAHVEVLISDTGQGVEPSFLPHMFERFRQADSSTTRDHGGLGLGLALVRQLVEAHGGTVAASSNGLGTGTTITVTLPARAEAAAQPPYSGGGDELAGRRVLVLENDDDARELAAVMLESAGATVRVSRTAAEALEALSDGRFDLIVADLALPHVDGFAFMREVRRRGLRIPALAVTAFSDDAHQREAYAAGFGGFTIKPITPESLQSALRSVIQTA